MYSIKKQKEVTYNSPHFKVQTTSQLESFILTPYF